MKRFWNRAEARAEDDGFAILLDGRPVRLPGGAVLRVASAPLAEALAAEWDAAGGGTKGAEVRWTDLGLTRLVGTAIERIAPDPAPTIGALAAYAETDLLCHRAEDRRLAERQAREWQPLLEWAAHALDAPLRTTVGLMPIPQPPAASGGDPRGAGGAATACARRPWPGGAGAGVGGARPCPGRGAAGRGGGLSPVRVG